MSILGAAAIGVGSSILGGVLGSSGQSKANRENYRYQQQLMNQQNAFNLDMWNKENAYNDPSAVMQRLKAAGLNPNLVYGNGSSTLSAASAPHAAGSSYQSQNTLSQLGKGIESAGATYLQARMNDAAVNNLESRTNMQDTQSDMIKLKTLTEILRQDKQVMSNSLLRQTSPLTVKAMEAQIRKTLQDTELSSSRTAAQDINNQTLGRYNEAKIRQTLVGVELNNAQINSIVNSVAQRWQEIGIKRSLSEAQRNAIGNAIRTVKYQGDLAKARTELTSKGIDWYTSDKIFKYISGIIPFASGLK